jgi:hypothetical protein
MYMVSSDVFPAPALPITISLRSMGPRLALKEVPRKAKGEDAVGAGPTLLAPMTLAAS